MVKARDVRGLLPEITDINRTVKECETIRQAFNLGVDCGQNRMIYEMEKREIALSREKVINSIRSIPSTKYPIESINGMHYFFMSKEEIADAIIASEADIIESPTEG